SPGQLYGIPVRDLPRPIPECQKLKSALSQVPVPAAQPYPEQTRKSRALVAEYLFTNPSVRSKSTVGLRRRRGGSMKIGELANRAGLKASAIRY
ncbi:MAG: hypothetical protein DMG42_12760, partial [Acidobacteria bacterium]